MIKKIALSICIATRIIASSSDAGGAAPMDIDMGSLDLPPLFDLSRSNIDTPRNAALPHPSPKMSDASFIEQSSAMALSLPQGVVPVASAHKRKSPSPDSQENANASAPSVAALAIASAAAKAAHENERSSSSASASASAAIAQAAISHTCSHALCGKTFSSSRGLSVHAAKVHQAERLTENGINLENVRDAKRRKLNPSAEKETKEAAELSNAPAKAAAQTFICPHCQRDCHRGPGLVSHIRYKHADINPASSDDGDVSDDQSSDEFDCPHCDFKGKAKKGFVMHMKYKHPKGEQATAKENADELSAPQKSARNASKKVWEYVCEFPGCRAKFPSEKEAEAHQSRRHSAKAWENVEKAPSLPAPTPATHDRRKKLEIAQIKAQLKELLQRLDNL